MFFEFQSPYVGGSKATQIERHIMGLMREGRLRIGDRLPTYDDYAAILGASDDQVREAYEWLIKKKLVGGHQFLGHFVIANANHPNLIDPPPKAK